MNQKQGAYPVFHRGSKHPEQHQPGGKCKCGGKLIHREDDKPEAIRSRLEWSVEEAKPLIKKYQELGVFVKIDGERPIDVIFKDIMSRIKKEPVLRDRRGPKDAKRKNQN